MSSDRKAQGVNIVPTPGAIRGLRNKISILRAAAAHKKSEAHAKITDSLHGEALAIAGQLWEARQSKSADQVANCLQTYTQLLRQLEDANQNLASEMFPPKQDVDTTKKKTPHVKVKWHGTQWVNGFQRLGDDDNWERLWPTCFCESFGWVRCALLQPDQLKMRIESTVSRRNLFVDTVKWLSGIIAWLHSGDEGLIYDPRWSETLRPVVERAFEIQPLHEPAVPESDVSATSPSDISGYSSDSVEMLRRWRAGDNT